ncbi:MAG: hypothetical protein RLZZ204_776 [Bacteroidota bacterium]
MVSVAVGLMLFCNSCSNFPISNDTIPSKSHLALPEINIKGNAMVAKRRGDTLVFAADRYKRADAIRLEQLLSNVPGFQVDANGRISFNGKTIQKLMLDGDDLTAENYQLISRNLRSLLIDSIQVIEKYNENRLLKGMNDDKGIAINLVLNPSYYGRPTVNLILAYAPKKNGELQTEIIHLRNKMKQLVLVNTNNIGAYPIQNQLMDQPEQERYEVLFRSWPHLLHNNYIGGLSNRYINQNSDWGLAYATTIRMNKFTLLRFNLQKSLEYMTNRVEQNQLFSFGDDLAIGIHTANLSNRKNNTTNGFINWERDKGGKNTSKYQFKFYHAENKINVSEERELISLQKILSHSTLYSKGLTFSVTQTWKSNSNQVWMLESAVDISSNRYKVFVFRNDLVHNDSSNHQFNQIVSHTGGSLRTGIGYFKNVKSISFKFWLRSTISTIYSKQNFEQLDVTVLKKYISAHVTKNISKKMSFEIQSMIGAIGNRFDSKQSLRMIYHLDHAFIWKRKNTQQVSFNYGLLRQGAEIRKLFAGEVYLNGTTLMKGPTDLSFPVSIYGQLNFSTMDLYRGLTIGGQLMIKRVIGDYFMSVGLNPFFTKMTELLNGRQLNRSLNLHIEKIIHPIRMKYRIQTNLMHLNNLTQFNDQQFFAINQIYRFGNYLSTNWRRGYNVQVEYNYLKSNFSGLHTHSKIWNNRHEYKASSQFQFSRQLNAVLTLTRYQGKNSQTLDLLDCTINWMIVSKYRLYVQGYNLLNRKLYVEQVINTNSISTSEQQLIGRRVIVGLDLPL